MPEDKPELEKLEQRIIEVNEWFTPFPNYDDIPYEEDADEKDFRQKIVEIEVANVGRVRIGLRWNQDALKGSLFNSGLLILSNTNKVVIGNELIKEQERIESRIMKIHLGLKVDKYTGNEIRTPYQVELETPSGDILSRQLSDEVTTALDSWIDQHGNKIPMLAIPDVANIVEKIQIRFVPKD